MIKTKCPRHGAAMLPIILRAVAAPLALASPLGLDAGPAAAAELLVGVGWDDPLGDEGALAALVEVRSEPLFAFGALEVRAGVAGELDGDGDLWLGGGVVAFYPLGSGFRAEASVMPGYYNMGAGNDLGGNFQFRSEAGVSVAVSGAVRLGVSISHKSNARLREENPGVETVLVKANYAF